MNKQELIEAIEATLVPNGNKAITADALRNLLTDIVENSGSGGGGGITFQIGIEPDETGNAMVYTTTPEQIAHNKEQIDILKQLHDEGKPTPPMALEFIGTEGHVPVSQIMMYVIQIMWDTTATEVPEGLIFPMVMFMDECTINGDGTILQE